MSSSAGFGRDGDWSMADAALGTSAEAVTVPVRASNEKKDLSGPRGESSLAGLESNEGVVLDKRRKRSSIEPFASTGGDRSSIFEGGIVAAVGVEVCFSESRRTCGEAFLYVLAKIVVSLRTPMTVLFRYKRWRLSTRDRRRDLRGQ